MTLTVVGSLNYDMVSRAQRVPDGGETVLATDFQTHHGGKGANEALGLARLNSSKHKVKMIGCVGDDAFGHELVHRLSSEGVDTTGINQSQDKSTGIATILVDAHSENRIIVYPGANELVRPENVPQSVLEESEYVLLQNEIPLETTLDILERVHKLPNVKSVYNPSPLLSLPQAKYSLVDILVVNSGEAGAINGTDVTTLEDGRDAAAEIADKGVGLVVVTMGSLGAVWYSKESGGGYEPSNAAGTIVDTTCAGDTFLAALIAQLASGNPVNEAIKFANKASGIAVTRPGAQSSIPFLSEMV